MTRLTSRDNEIIQTLCTKVRLFNLEQLAVTWWPDASSAHSLARQRMNKLAEVELVQKQRVLAAPLPALEHPICTWTPGQPKPDCGAIAWRLQERWILGPKASTVFSATRKATRTFGGKRGNKLKVTFQATHDLGVSQMYLHLLTSRLTEAEQWIGEDILAPHRRRQKLPDAVIAKRADARPKLVLEFGGAYDKRRVESFHADCAKRRLPYELW